MAHRLLWALLAGGALAGGSASLPFDRPCLEPRDICPAASLEEPSGICWHAERRKLYAVGDEGDLCEMDARGGNLRKVRLGELDLEGITVGPEGKLYVAVEAPPEILVVDPEKLEIERRLRLDDRLDGERVLWLKPDAGLEGICYAPELGAFFAVNQLEPARLVELDVPRRGTLAKVKRIIAELSDPVACASDLAWDAVSEHLLVTSSSHERRPGRLWELTLDGEVAKRRNLPGERQEGFCVDGDGNAYVAQDSGGILRVEPWREDPPVRDVDAFVRDHPLAAGQKMRMDEVSRDATASVHILQLRGEVAPNVHDHHEEMVFLWRGAGRLRFGDETTPMKAGSLARIPRGVVHGFVAEGEEPAVAVIVFTPPFDGKDRRAAPEK